MELGWEEQGAGDDEMGYGIWDGSPGTNIHLIEGEVIVCFVHTIQQHSTSDP